MFLFITDTGIKYRLSDRWYGKLEINYDNEWGRVCNNNWDDNDASVVCKQLGYVDGRVEREHVDASQSPGYVRMDNVDCKGDERSVLECKHSGYWKPEKPQCNDAAVRCNITSK